MDNRIKQLLEELGFKEGKNKQYIKEKENGLILGVNFSKNPTKGEPFANQNGNFFDDITGIQELDDYIKRRDEILNSSAGIERQSNGNDTEKQGTTETTSSLDAGQKPFSTTPNVTPTPSRALTPSAPTSNKTFLDEIVFAYEIDIAEIFGGAGDGKSQTVKQFALDAIAQGKKVCFVDTERGFLRRDIQKLGSSYRYISNLNDLLTFCKNLQKTMPDVDLLIIDSVGYPVLTEWAKLGVKERGDALTQIIAIKDLIKDWAINNQKVAIVTNQPDSDFGKDKGYINRPFGDKGQFVIKEVFKIERTDRKPTMTKSVITAFRSRHDGMGQVIAHVEITESGVKFI